MVTLNPQRCQAPQYSPPPSPWRARHSRSRPFSLCPFSTTLRSFRRRYLSCFLATLAALPAFFCSPATCHPASAAGDFEGGPAVAPPGTLGAFAICAVAPPFFCLACAGLSVPTSQVPKSRPGPPVGLTGRPQFGSHAAAYEAALC